MAGRNGSGGEANPDGPRADQLAMEWPPAGEVFRRGRFRYRVMVAAGATSLIGGLVLLVVLHGRDDTELLNTALIVIGPSLVVGGSLLALQWLRVRRALTSTPWVPARVQVCTTPGGQGLYDVVFLDTGRVSQGSHSLFVGSVERSGLLHRTGFSMLNDPTSALVAGHGPRRQVLTTATGGLLLPLRGPRSPRQRERWQRRWTKTLTQGHQPLPQGWTTATET